MGLVRRLESGRPHLRCALENRHRPDTGLGCDNIYGIFAVQRSAQQDVEYTKSDISRKTALLVHASNTKVALLKVYSLHQSTIAISTFSSSEHLQIDTPML